MYDLINTVNIIFLHKDAIYKILRLPIAMFNTSGQSLVSMVSLQYRWSVFSTGGQSSVWVVSL